MSLSRRVLVVLALQAIALGVLATGALGTSKDGPQIAASPQVSIGSSVAHDTSAALADLTPVANDPNRVIPEFERQTQPSVSATPSDIVGQTAVAGPAVPGTTAAFTGLELLDLSAGYVPPDTVGDVGLTQYVQAVNGGLDVFSKTGDNLTGAIDDSTFWSGLTGCAPTSTRGLTDPTVNYDQFAGRWVYSVLSIDISQSTYGQSYMCVAVSATSDATDSWNRYVFAAGNGVLPDYPKLGVWPDGYYFSFNNFNNAAPHSFTGAGAMVVERTAMLTGATAQSVFMDLRGVSGLLGGMLPSDADGATPPPVTSPTTPNYYVTPVDDATNANDQLGIWAFHVDWATPANSTFTNPQAVSVSAFSGNTQRSVPQPGTSTQLDGLADDRLMNRVQYRNFGTHETLVTNLSVDNGTGGIAPRWFELRKTAGSWSVNQESTFKPTALNRWIGSVAMDGNGDMALGYSAGDAATAPQLRYTGRLVSDSLSVMQPEATLAGGGGSQTGTTRWGDYSQMSVDPTDDCTFWYTGEFYTSTAGTTWSTRIGSFRFPSCAVSNGPTYSVVPSISGFEFEGDTLTASPGTWSPVPTSTSYQWRRCDSPSGVFCTNIPGATASTYDLVAADAGKRIRVNVTVTAAPPAGTTSAVSDATFEVVPFAPVNLSSPVVTGTKQVAQTLTGTTGTWSSYPSTPTTFTYQWERCVLSCGVIPGATSSTYTLVAADAGTNMMLEVTAHSTGGDTPDYSALTAVVQLPPGPLNTVSPVLSGTAQAGSTLSASTGTWTGAAPITVGFQWQSCSSTGTNCSNIIGQTTSSYSVNSGDVGRTVRATLTATNSGGSTVVNTAPSAVIAAAASSGGGGGSSGGGGGGGGTGGALDLTVTGYQTPANPLPGQNVTYVLAVDDLTPNQLAQNVYLNVTLPAGVSLVSSSADRGSGCVPTSATQLRCYLDFLSGQAPRANVLIVAKVIAEGTHVFSASVTAQQSESSLSNNTLTLTYGAGAGASNAPVGLNGDGTPTKKQDKKKPSAQALYTTAKRGKTAKLRFKIYDDQGVAKAVTTIKRGAAVVGTAGTGYGPVAYGSVYYVGWHVPARAVKGNYWFCVVAVDRAGNKSAQSCAPLALK